MPIGSDNMQARDRKQILIVEDEAINRELLTLVLQESYTLRYAATGEETLKEIFENARSLSLVLLDLNLPDVNGKDILLKMKQEGLLDRLPVIVLTADKDAEVESLTMGAMDFIPKPYPLPEVIQARVRRTIELSEGRVIIGQTERDSLTGLYNREYFYLYTEQLDARHSDTLMDAIVININHFHMINERYGRQYGDEVLKKDRRKAANRRFRWDRHSLPEGRRYIPDLLSAPRRLYGAPGNDIGERCGRRER